MSESRFMLDVGVEEAVITLYDIQSPSGEVIRARAGEWIVLVAGEYTARGVAPQDWSTQFDLAEGQDCVKRLVGSLVVLIADAGGRELGGLRLQAQGEGSLVVGRVGLPLPLPPGTYELSIDCHPPLHREVLIRGGESQELDLGRLASVLVTCYTADSQVLAGLPLELSRSDGGGRIRGILGKAFEVWPGDYSLSLSGPLGDLSRDVSLRGGALNEVELGVGATEQRLRTLAGEFTGALRTVGRRMNLPERPQFLRRSPKPEPELLIMRDALGQRCRLALESALSEGVVLETEEVVSLPRGEFSLSLIAGPPGNISGSYDGSGSLELPALAAIEVHLKDPWGVSLRGARLQLIRLEDGSCIEGRMGEMVPVVAGKYLLKLLSFGGYDREIEAVSGQVVVCDLGFCAHLEVPFEGIGQEISICSVEEGEAWSFLTQTGSEILLPLGKYRVSYADGTQRTLKSRTRKKRKPTVTVRILGDVSPEGEASSLE